ncbi:MAG TPA: VOC family protein [Fimbriiglobus sp.]|jgi:catechol 2,3-dioxygenase-like lactoylglutathione lyase family enzyme|nr:VOC family protein [Fimbriiglobus sp.]
MTELSVADFAASLAWYRDVLGLRVKHLDVANRFVLFDGGVALKGGTPAPGGVVLHFNVSDLNAELTRLGVAASPVEESAEGYREAFTDDPDGYWIGLFEWT